MAPHTAIPIPTAPQGLFVSPQIRTNHGYSFFFQKGNCLSPVLTKSYPDGDIAKLLAEKGFRASWPYVHRDAHLPFWHPIFFFGFATKTSHGLVTDHAPASSKVPSGAVLLTLFDSVTRRTLATLICLFCSFFHLEKQLAIVPWRYGDGAVEKALWRQCSLPLYPDFFFEYTNSLTTIHLNVLER